MRGSTRAGRLDGLLTLSKSTFSQPHVTDRWGGTEGDPEVMGAGSLRKAREERAGDGIPKGAGAGRNRK